MMIVDAQVHLWAKDGQVSSTRDSDLNAFPVLVRLGAFEAADGQGGIEGAVGTTRLAERARWSEAGLT
jgi:hypothetical protein